MTTIERAQPRGGTLQKTVGTRRLVRPVLLVCGDSDPLVGAACESVLLRGLPNVARVELNQCGHFPCFSHPEVLAEVIRRFLTPPACSA